MFCEGSDMHDDDDNDDNHHRDENDDRDDDENDDDDDYVALQMSAARSCSQGVDCIFCHVPHTHDDLAKVGLARRTYCQRFAAVIFEEFGQPLDFDELAVLMSSHSRYLYGQLLDLRGLPHGITSL